MTKTFFFIVLMAITYSLSGQSEEGTIDYPLLYEQDFESPTALRDFERTDPSAWRLQMEENGKLELFGKSNYEARVRSPFNIALINNLWVGDFVLEVDLAQTGREYGHRRSLSFLWCQRSH